MIFYSRGARGLLGLEASELGAKKFRSNGGKELRCKGAIELGN